MSMVLFFQMFTPILGKMIQFDEHIFQMGGSTTTYWDVHGT